MDIIPIECKGGHNVSAASLKWYISKLQPKEAIRFSKKGYRKDGKITNLPLYLAPITKSFWINKNITRSINYAQHHNPRSDSI